MVAEAPASGAAATLLHSSEVVPVAVLTLELTKVQPAGPVTVPVVPFVVAINRLFWRPLYWYAERKFKLG